MEQNNQVTKADGTSKPENKDNSSDEDEAGMTNAYSVSDLLGELDENDSNAKSATLRSNQSVDAHTGPTEDINGGETTAKSSSAGIDVNENLAPQNEEGNSASNLRTKPNQLDLDSDIPTPAQYPENLYHSPQEVLQKKRESLLRENQAEHTYYNDPGSNQSKNGQVVQDIGGRFHVVGAQNSDTKEPNRDNPQEHDYYNVVNPNYQEPEYNEVPPDSPYYNEENKTVTRHAKETKSVKWAAESYQDDTDERDSNPPMYLQDFDHSTVIDCSVEAVSEERGSVEPQTSGHPADIYENIGHRGDAGSSEGGTEDDWASDEFEEYEDSYQSVSSDKSKKSKGPPTLPPRNQNDIAGSKDSDQPLPPTPSMFDKLAAKLNRSAKSVSEEVEDDDSPMMEVMLNLDKHPAPALPPIPENLEPLQLKRRHIVSSIVESEVSYTASLRNLVEEYEKPLLTAKPEIISRKAIRVIFYKVREILQCHNMFHIELAECVRVWDEQETIGNIFTASFSKSIVFEAYSEFVNNFSVAMDTAKKQARTKQIFSDFLKNKIKNSADKLSLFGLMVKPVQRFPQFIMLLQDLLKQTPQKHHDRIPLQMALTELENLTHKLNETKRESESRHEVRRIVANMTGRFSLKPEIERFLVRQDDLMQIEHINGEAKSKQRRLLLLNDHVVCATVVFKESDVGGNEAKYKIKWAVPVSDIELVQGSVPAPYQVQIGRGKTTVTAVRTKDQEKTGSSPPQNPFKKELDDMLHDLPVVEHIGQLVGQLRLRYEGITPECINGLTKTLQLMIQQKCDVDKCIIRISIPAKYQAKSTEKLRKEVSKQMNNMKRKHVVHPSKPKRGSNRLTFTFQTDSPGIKQDWLLELQNTRLALDPKNNPGWNVPENEMSFTFKLPLFIRPLLIDITKQDTKVQCAVPVILPGEAPGVGIQHLWVCSGAEGKGQVTIVSMHTNQPHAIESFVACNSLVSCCTPVPGFSNCDDPYAFHEDTVWMGTHDNKIVIRPVTEDQRSDAPRQVIVVENPISCIHYLNNHVYAGLKNGILLIFGRNIDGVWGIEDKEMLYLGDLPVTCLLQVNTQIWASSGNKVHMITVTTHHVEGDFYRDEANKESHELNGQGTIECMVTAGVGLLVSFKNKSVIQLYHLETFEHLQDVSVSSNISRVFEGTGLDFWAVSITSLLACRGLLWVGTNVGVSLTLPLPRLEGVPQVKGRPNVAYHAHTGPIKFLCPIQCGAVPIPAPSISRPDSYAPSEASGDTSLTDSGSFVPPTEEPEEQRFTQSDDFTGSRHLASPGMGKWTSTPDLRHVELYDNDVASLYGSLLRVDEDIEQEIIGPSPRRRVKSAHLNISKQVSRISEVVSNKISGHAHPNPKCATLPILHEEQMNESYHGYEFNRERKNSSAKDSPQSVSSQPHDSGESQSIKSDSISSDSSTTVAAEADTSCEPVRPSGKAGLPTYPGIQSHLMHSKSCIIVSGGEGHVNWSDTKAADSRYEDICLLLWNCRN